MTFQKGAKKLSYAGTTINAFTLADNPIPTGKHPIQIPDFPHSLGNSYSDRTQGQQLRRHARGQGLTARSIGPGTLALLVTISCQRVIEPVVSQEQLEDPAAMQRARPRVTSGHVEAARKRSLAGDEQARRGGFSAATKAYGEAALFDPTPERLLTLRAADVRMERARGSAQETLAAERQANAAAARQLLLVERLAAPNGQVHARARLLRTCLEAATDRNAAIACVDVAGVRP